MTKLINKLLYFINGIAEQVSLVDPEALIKVTAIESKSVKATDGTQSATLDKTGLALSDAAGADAQSMSHIVLKNLVVLQGLTGSRAATYAQLQSEIDARALRDGQLTQAINDEIGRASTAESNLSGAIGQESIDRASADSQIRLDFAAADSTIRGEFAAADMILSGSIGTEALNRDNQYNGIQMDIDSEVIRASGVESGLNQTIGNLSQLINTDEGNLSDAQQALADEIDARNLQYNEISGAISDETMRAEQAEADLQAQIGAAPSKLEWQDSVISEVAFDSLPMTPATGARYLVISGTNANSVAQWNGSAYVFTTPTLGMFVTVDDQDNSIKYYNGSAWVAKVWENYIVGAGLNLTSNTMKVADLGVIEAMLADGSVTGAKIADSAVDGVTIEKAVVAPTILIEQLASNGETAIGANGSFLRGQSFTLSAPQVVPQIDIGGSSQYSGTANVIIHEIVGGIVQLPVIGQVSIDTNTDEWQNAIFSTPLSLGAGQYMLCVYSTLSTFAWRRSSTNPYAGGQCAVRVNGEWIFDQFSDYKFRVMQGGGPAQLAVKNSGVTAEKLANDAITDIKVSATADIQMSKIDGLEAALLNAQSNSTSIAISNPLGTAEGGSVMYQAAANADLACAANISTCRALLGLWKHLTISDDVILIVGKKQIVAETGITFAVGEIAYLSASEPGKVTNVAPTALNSCVVEVGVMLSVANMLIKPAFKYKIV